MSSQPSLSITSLILAAIARKRLFAGYFSYSIINLFFHRAFTSFDYRQSDVKVKRLNIFTVSKPTLLAMLEVHSPSTSSGIDRIASKSSSTTLT
jgi:hypothetical protein